MYYVTLKHVRVTIVAMEKKNKNYIFASVYL